MIECMRERLKMMNDVRRLMPARAGGSLHPGIAAATGLAVDALLVGPPGPRLHAAAPPLARSGDSPAPQASPPSPKKKLEGPLVGEILMNSCISTGI